MHASARITDALLGWPPLRHADTVALFASLSGEPDTKLLRERLRATGTTVLLPCVADDLDLDWAPDDGSPLVCGPWGTRQPDTPPLGLDGLSRAQVVLVPALAVALDGTRLGRGGGSYDRALLRVAPGVPVVALVFADEVRDQLPSSGHDVAVSAAATPDGIRRLGSI